MGCYVGFWGGGDGIIADKLTEYLDRVRVILDLGGMMSIEIAELGGHRVPLLAPPRVREHPAWGAKDGHTETDIEFWFNFFEHEAWEGSCVSIKTGFYSGGKVGTSVFRCVSLAVNVLREFYTTRPGLADNNGGLSGAGAAIAWFNYLFSEIWTNKRVMVIAQLYNADPHWNRNKSDIVSERVSSIDPTKSNMLDITRALVMRGDYRTLQEIVDCELYPGHHLTISKCAFFFFYALKHGEYPKSDTMALLKFEVIPELQSDKDLMVCYGHWLPVDIAAKIVSDYYDCGDFTEIKNELEPYYDVKRINELYSRRNQSTDPNDPQKSTKEASILVAFAHRPLDWATEADLRYTAPIKPLSTEDYLTIALKYDDHPRVITGDDRAHWWAEDNDVVFSDDFRSWLAELSAELKSIVSGDDLPATSEVLPLMMSTLARAHDAMGYPVMFSSAFYDFLSRAEEPRVKAAVVLLGRILARTKAAGDGTMLERYCAVLSNNALRKKVFDF